MGQHASDDVWILALPHPSSPPSLSGILPAQNAARHLDVPLLFAREKRPITMDESVYEAKSKSRTKGHEYSLFSKSIT